MTWTAYSERFERNGILADLDKRAALRRRYRMLIFLLASAFGILQVCLAGYDLGVGNQTIQIPYLKHLINPQLYADDPAISGTIDQYPSYAYQLLAYVCVLVDYQIIYAVLHVICSISLFAAVFYASLYLAGEIWSGLCAALLLLIGQHHALAGADIYSIGFTHTWLSTPWMLWVLVFVWQQRLIAAGICLGLLFNIHALHAAYTAVFVTAIVSALYPMRLWWRIFLVAGPAMLCALPTLIHIISAHAEINHLWHDLMYIRSAHHSFPITLWAEGDGSIASFAQIILLTCLLSCFIKDPYHKLMAQRVFLVFLLLLAVGLYATHSATILKAQLWRSSGMILLLSCLVMGHGFVQSWRYTEWPMRLWSGIAALAFFCAVLPSLQPCLYIFLIALTVMSLVNGIMTVPAALLIALCHVLVILSYYLLSVPLWSWPNDLHVDWSSLRILASVAAFIVLINVLWRMAKPDMRGFVVQANVCVLLLAGGFLSLFFLMIDGNKNAWLDTQDWVRMHTKVDARIATPANRNGFRIHGERSLIGEWRDGTQMYFAADYAGEWWQRMQQLQFGLQYDASTGKLNKRGRSYEFANDEELLTLAQQSDVDYFVLPASRETELKSVYANAQWQVCLPKRKPQPPPPAFAKKKKDWQAQHLFIKQTIEPNIKRFRTCELQLQFVDQHGKPLKDLNYELTLKKHAFGFGSGLPFFKEHKDLKRKRFVPPVVKDSDLEHFRQVFNWSTIPYSAKWFYIEAVEGKPFYDDLDAYVNWCVAENVDLEFHFVTGYEPQWVKKRDRDGRQAALVKHTNEMIDRYGEHIKHWQVVNEKKLLRESIAAFKVFRERMPEAKLGISDCARFYTKQKEDSPKRDQDLLRGMKEIKWLREQGVNIDFFAFHGHRPFGLWADLRVLYETLDKFAAEGVRVHISEFGMHVNKTILGDVRTGKWDEELQAEYYALIYKACFSHPAVDVINMWGFSAQTWMTGSGLMNKDGKPKPAFFRLKKLIHEELHTHEQGVLPVHGRIKHRAYYGDYQITVGADQQQLRIPLHINRSLPAQWKIVIDTDKNICVSTEALQ